MELLFKNLHRASLGMSTHLLAGCNTEQLEIIEQAIDRGAYITLEIGKLPDPTNVALILVWPDGRRAIAAHLSITRESLQ